MATGFPPKIRAIIDARADTVCEGCGQARVHEHHHRIPRGSGGTRNPMKNWASNGMGLCRDCHHFAETNRTIAKLLGWLLPQSCHHAATERVLRRGEWVYLNEDGTYEAG